MAKAYNKFQPLPCKIELEVLIFFRIDDSANENPNGPGCGSYCERLSVAVFPIILQVKFFQFLINDLIDYMKVVSEIIIMYSGSSLPSFSILKLFVTSNSSKFIN